MASPGLLAPELLRSLREARLAAAKADRNAFYSSVTTKKPPQGPSRSKSWDVS